MASMYKMPERIDQIYGLISRINTIVLIPAIININWQTAYFLPILFCNSGNKSANET